MFRFLCILIIGLNIANAQVIDMPAQSSNYYGDARGFWFTAPNNFTITQLDVPTDLSRDPFHVAVVRFNAGVSVPGYPNVTNSFDTLHYSVNNIAPVSVNIAVNAGDVIGILGNRGDNNSYGSIPYNATINGTSVPLYRLGMDFNLSSNSPKELWKEAYNRISRVLVTTAPSTSGSTSSPKAVPMLNTKTLFLLMFMMFLLSAYKVIPVILRK